MSSDIAAAVAPGQLELLDLAAIGGDASNITPGHFGTPQHQLPLPHHNDDPTTFSPSSQEKEKSGATSVRSGSRNTSRGTSPQLARSSSAHKFPYLPHRDSNVSVSSAKFPLSKKVADVAGAAKSVADVKNKVKAKVAQKLCGSQRKDSDNEFEESVRDEAVNIRTLWADARNGEDQLGVTFKEEVSPLPMITGRKIIALTFSKSL